MKISAQKLKKIVAKFSRKKILVVGDLILDHYIIGRVDRISPEAPVPVVWAGKEEFVCGGAANVGLNLAALKAKASLCGVVGRDHFGRTLLERVKGGNIAADMIVGDKGRPTTLKTRIVGNRQQVVRVDWESIEPLSLKVNRKLLDILVRNITGFDAVIIEDYGKGIINPALVGDLVALCKKHNKIITVDPKEEHIDYYAGVTCLTPNLKEAQTAANFKIRTRAELPLLGELFINRLKPKGLLITMGEDGMMLFDGKNKHHIPTAALEVFDVSGAGDTVIAVFTLALACGASFYEAAYLSNLAAGIVVGKLGAAAAGTRELLDKINQTCK